jgi:hypothetical protein
VDFCRRRQQPRRTWRRFSRPHSCHEACVISSLVSIGAVGIHFLSSVNRSSWDPRPTLARSEPTRTASARSAQSPEPPARGSPRDLAIGIDTGEINGPVWSLSGRGTTGAFRSRRADRGAQVLPPAGATVPPWLPAKSARVSNLPACCVLGPPACAAPCSCHREACSARSAWPHPGKACPSV